MIGNFIGVISAPFVSLCIGSALAIWGIVLSINAKVKNNLTFLKVESVVLGVSNPTWQDSLEIKYDGVLIPRLCAARFGVWNAGNTTIDGIQIASNDALRILTPPDAKILTSNIISQSRSVINAQVLKADDQTSVISFDFLDPGDGFVIQTAQSSVHGELSIVGTIRGIPNGIRDWRRRPLGGSKFEKVYGSVVAGFGTALLITVAGFISNMIKSVKSGFISDDVASIIAIVLIVMVGPLTFLIAPPLYSKIRARRIPKNVKTDPVLSIQINIK